MDSNQNQHVYGTPGVVHHYAQLNILQPAEAAILKLFQDQWPQIKMLDIGVGGGRTTQHFFPRTLEYVGIDYSADMIAACKKRFRSTSKPLVFDVCDARDMGQFEDNSFDFILFSFNGIDSLSHSDRQTVFQEISRVGKSGGHFFFSSHNLQGMEREFDIRKHLGWNPLTTYVNLVMLALLRLFNRPLTLAQLEASAYAMIQDEPHNFRLKQYYIRPTEQLHQLASGFRDVQIYSWKSGLELTNKALLDANTDMWLYYLCVIK